MLGKELQEILHVGQSQGHLLWGFFLILVPIFFILLKSEERKGTCDDHTAVFELVLPDTKSGMNQHDFTDSVKTIIGVSSDGSNRLSLNNH